MIREYKCEDCYTVIEVWERFEKVPTCCSTCGGNLKRVISRNNFHLKGSGWYCTDYKNNKQKSVGKKE